MTEIDIILKLQQISNKVLDYIMYFLTQFGDETFFIAAVLIIFWCIDKKFGYKFIVVYMFGQLFTGLFKSIFKRPRPYENGARAIISKSSGYSFPSGHSQSIANITTQSVLYINKNHRAHLKSAIITAVILTATVMLTRMYLGQHYLSDIVAGASLGLIAAIAFSKLFDFLGDKEERLMYVFLPLSIILTVAFSGLNADVCKVAGALGSVSLGYYLEKRYVGYNVKSAKFYHHIIKILAGGIVLIAVKEGIKLIGAEIGLTGAWLITLNYIRYFLVGIIASLLAPFVFKTLKI